MILKKILVLGLGGFAGSNLRYWTGSWVNGIIGTWFAGSAGFPFGTLFVNGVGSFLLGFLVVYGTEVVEMDPNLRLLLGTGFLGALTTFSTFSVETVTYLRESSYHLAAANTLLNLVISLLLAWLGFSAAKTFL
jgi:fluoride exporter